MATDAQILKAAWNKENGPGRIMRWAHGHGKTMPLVLPMMM